MPEGDTIFRTATSIRKWVGGREVTSVQTKVRGLQLDRVVGKTITEVEPRAKHLLIRFSNGLSLHTHMRMTGAWHVYGTSDRWRKPPYQAKIVITCGDRLIVCFNAPVVEMLLPSEERRHQSIQGLGPDVLGEGDFDFEEVRARAGKADPSTVIGELLLDQRVVSGIGNIYRCESLYVERIDPWLEHGELSAEQLDQVVKTAIRLMKVGAYTGLRPMRWVYGRTGQPCRTCGTQVSIARLGVQARDIYWCRTCQASKSQQDSTEVDGD